MSNPFTGKRSLCLAVLTAMLSSVPGSLSGQGPLRLRFPDQDPGGPVYARVERPFLVHDGLYAAIVFYRDPDCVPADFNLLDNVDLEGFPMDARAFRCALTAEGFQIWTTNAFPGPPNFVLTTGSGAVPVWFVAWSELQAALADDTLLIDELRSMSSLQVGYANHYQETLQLTSAGETFSLELAASGAMTDGGSFWVNYVFREDVANAIQIRIK